MHNYNFEYKKLNKIPDDALYDEELEYLSFSGNDLSELPEELYKRTNLKLLALTGNKLKSIPAGISKLKNLEQLYLSSNHLSEIPDEIFELKNLQVLCLAGNDYTELPEKVANLEKLKKITLNDKIKNIPPEIIARSQYQQSKIDNSQGNPDPIFEFLKEKSKGTKEVLNEIKLLIVGEGEVGKTCLRKKLIHNQYNEEKTTPGFDREKWETEKDIVIEKWKQNLIFNVWDFGGQQIFHATHKFFLTKRSVYLLLWEGRKGYDTCKVENWLEVIKTLAEDSPVFIVLNKVDEYDDNLDLKNLKGKYPQIVDHYKISCKSSIGIENLRMDLLNKSSELDHIKELWPMEWFNIKEILENDLRNEIKEEEFIEICKKHNVNESSSINLLDEFLHDLGVILHFKDDMALRDTIFLKPNWVAKSFYGILSDLTIQGRNGIFTSEDIRRIWSNGEYNNMIRSNLISLMSKDRFEICFKLNGEEKYIIPQLLSREQAQYEDWERLNENKEKNKIHFEYKCNVLLAGIFSRFIVKMHEYIITKDEAKLCWRYGTFLEYNSSGCNSKAKIISDERENKITVEIIGDCNREFLTIIREGFKKIYQSFPRLAVEEMVSCVDDCPYLHSYSVIIDFYRNGEPTIQCPKCRKHVSITKLIEGVELDLTKLEIGIGRMEIHGDYIEGDKKVENRNVNAGRDINAPVNQGDGSQIEVRDIIINGQKDEELTRAISELAEQINNNNMLNEDKEDSINAVNTIIYELNKENTNPNRIIRLLDNLHKINEGIKVITDATKYVGGLLVTKGILLQGALPFLH